MFAFDTLGYAKKLREAGVDPGQAEAHAEAAREFIMTELATRHDLTAVRSDLDAARSELTGRLESVRRELELKMDTQTLRLTVRVRRQLVLGNGGGGTGRDRGG